MAPTQPTTELDPRFSSPEATPTSWTDGEAALGEAEVYWLSTVRLDGRPHVAPLMAVWLDGALYFCTGHDEQKARNLARNPRCVLTTGCNALDHGLDLVVEGGAVRVTDGAALQRIADEYESKYGSEWRYVVHDDSLRHAPESLRGDHTCEAIVFAVAPTTAFAFGKGEFSQTRWRFARG